MRSGARIARAGVRSFELALVRPLRVGAELVTRRRGLLLVVDDGEGHAGIAEAAPLPGLHLESLGEATAQLLELAGRIEGATIPATHDALPAWVEERPGGPGLHPSVRTGVEGAVLALLADRGGIDLPHLLAARPATRVRINGLLEGDPPAVLERAASLARSGYDALKIKVGRRDAGGEADLVAAVRGLVGPAVALRLDANRAWDLPTALDFARRVAPAGVEYLEEPLRSAGDLAAFASQSPVPVALDETLLGYSPQSPPPLRNVAALILKPSVLGGHDRALAWARFARDEGVGAVVSAAFPSAVGLALDIACAAALGGKTAHGLGTAGAFAANLWRAPPAIGGGSYDARGLPFRPGDFDLGGTRALR